MTRPGVNLFSRSIFRNTITAKHPIMLFRIQFLVTYHEPVKETVMKRETTSLMLTAPLKKERFQIDCTLPSATSVINSMKYAVRSPLIEQRKKMVISQISEKYFIMK